MRLLAPVMAFVVLVAGCASKSDPPAPKEQQQVDRLRALPFDDGALGVVTQVLGGAGVAIFDDAAADGTGPVRLTRWQVRNLAVEAANGGGVRGDALGELAVAPAGAPPLAYLIAAWATSYDSGSARFARTLIGERDWRRADRIVFPKLVMILFLADATAGGGTAGGGETTSAATAGGGTTGARVVTAAYHAAGPCSAATSFVQNAIAAVANALKVNTSGGGFFGFLGKIWNIAVDLATGVVKGLIDAVTRPVVNLLVDVFGVVATIAQVTSFLSTWRTDVKAEPDDTRFGVDGEVVTGRMTLRVDTAELPIPDLILDCAAAVGVNLRDAGSPAGSKVTWDANNAGPPNLSAKASADDKLSQDKKASYTYQTGQETRQLAQTGNEHAGYVQVTATVERNDIDKVRQLFAKLVLDQLPEIIRPLVEPVARPVLDAATRHLAAISDVNATGFATIRYHTEKEPSATPKPGAGGQPGGATARIPTDCPLSTLIGHGYAYVDRDTQHGLPGTLVCLYAQDRHGTSYLDIGLFPYAVTKEQVGDAQTVAIPGTSAAWLSGTCIPKPCYRLDAVIGGRTLSVAGGDAQSDVIIDITKRVLGVA